MQSDVFIIINMQDKNKTIPSLIDRLGRYLIKSSILTIIAEYIYKEKHSVPITIIDKESSYHYRHSIGGTDKKLIKSFIVPKLEDSLDGLDFLELTKKGLSISLDGLLNKNTFLLQISFISDKETLSKIYF